MTDYFEYETEEDTIRDHEIPSGPVQKERIELRRIVARRLNLEHKFVALGDVLSRLEKNREFNGIYINFKIFGQFLTVKNNDMLEMLRIECRNLISEIEDMDQKIYEIEEKINNES